MAKFIQLTRHRFLPLFGGVSRISPCIGVQKSQRNKSYDILSSDNTVRIGCASAFWGDTSVSGPQLIKGGNLNFLVYDYLSEITMSLLTAAGKRGDKIGYAPDFVKFAMAPNIKFIMEKGIRVVSNAGGIDPAGCAEALQSVCKAQGLNPKIAVVTGDDLMSQVDKLKSMGITEMQSGVAFPANIESMNAYLGAGPIAKALDMGADIVVTGRCVDSALVLGPLLHQFRWAESDFDKLSMGSLAGHLVECGAQCTGGIFTDWHTVPDWSNIGFPIVECSSEGDFVVTKPPATGGLVTKGTVSEQLLYETGDPKQYILPDVVCDFTGVQLHDVQGQENQAVYVTGAKGLPPPNHYKVSATYPDGWGMQVAVCIIGPRAKDKALRTAEQLLKRIRQMFRMIKLEDFTKVNLEVLGAEHSYGPMSKTPEGVREVVLRMGVQHNNRQALQLFAMEIAAAGTGMAPGLTGMVGGGRPRVSSLQKLFSHLYPKDKINVSISLDNQCQVYRPARVETRDYPVTSTAVSSDHPLPTLRGSHTYRLEDLAFTRSGDKGNCANIGVIARQPAYLPYLQEALTEEAVAQYFSHLLDPDVGTYGKQVQRYDVPGIHGMNFMLYNSLGGGGIASLRTDPQGKAYGQMLLDFTLSNMPDIDTLIGDPECKRNILQKIVEDTQSGRCPNDSYADYTGPVASVNPTGSPFANSKFMQNTSQEITGVNNNNSAGGSFGFGLQGLGNSIANSPGCAMTPQALENLRMTSNGGYSDQATEDISTAMTLEVSETTASVIIGAAGGKGIVKLQRLTQTNIQISKKGVYVPGTRNRIVTITGTPQNITKAQRIIQLATTQKDLEVSETTASVIIGAGGKGIVKLQRLTQTNIQISKKGVYVPGTRNRIVIITGTPQNITKAQRIIQLATTQKDLEVSETITGAIIGPGSKGIDELQQLTQTDIHISKKGVYVPGTRNQIVTITGTPENVAKAQHHIQSIQQTTTQKDMEVSETIMYAIIGPGGKGIVELQQLTQTHISHISKKDGNVPGTRNQIVTITGTPENVAKAQHHIQSIQQTTTQKDLEVSETVVGAIIGHGAKGIVELQQLTQTVIHVSKKDGNVPGTRNRIVTITGTPQNVAKAQHRIQSIQQTTTQKDMEVPETIMGAIIGHGGKGIDELQQLTQTNIQISKKGVYVPGTRNQIVTITGTPQNVAKAQHLIQSIQQTMTQQDLEVPETIMCAIIGHGGKVIDELRQLTQTHIHISKKGVYVPGTRNRLVTITGTPQNVAKAQHLIQSIQQTMTQQDLEVPETIMCAIIGHGGKVIDELRQLTQTHIHISKKGVYVPGTRNRLVTITGTPQNVAKAQHLIQSIQQTMTQQDLEVSETIMGAIIGPGGKEIDELQQLTQTYIHISKKGVYVPGTRNQIVTITGTPQNVAKAQHIIQQRIQQEKIKRASQAQAR